MLIRAGMIESSRIGHFVADTSIFLAGKSLRQKRPRIADIFWMPAPSANEQWARMTRRRLFVKGWVRYLVALNRRLPGGTIHHLSSPSMSGSRLEYTALRLSTERFTFTPDEEHRAKEWLRRRSWKEGEPFVCLQVRDSAYLTCHPLHASSEPGRWAYHDYRDSDINTYTEAVEALIRRGYWVIRMGLLVNQPLSVQHPHVIDYPFVDDKDDLLDIWLSINCRFFISSGSGIDILPWVYGVPVVYVNALPLLLAATQINHVWVPKHLRWKNSGKPLSLREHGIHGYGEAADYAAAGIEIQDLSPAEITAAVLELEERVAGSWKDSPEGVARQRRYWDVFSSMAGFAGFHDYVHPDARVGAHWLRSMGDSFLE